MRREALLLREMIDAARRVREVIGGLDVAALRADDLRREAILWNLTVLGEAAGRMPAEVKDAHADVAWAQSVRLRNRIVHGYWSVDLDIIHTVAADDLPVLIDQLSAVIADADEESGD